MTRFTGQHTSQHQAPEQTSGRPTPPHGDTTGIGTGTGTGGRRRPRFGMRSRRGARMTHDHLHFAHHGRGGRHRARRGAIVNAILLLLDERPMHGYELINELDERSEGRWRPSPGAIYPALGRMEQRGLVESEEIDAKKQFRLTDAGRTRLEEYRATLDADAAAPWEDAGRGGRGDLRGHVAELVGQVRQIGRFGTAQQIERAADVLTDAKRQLYSILATEPSDNPSAGPAAVADSPSDDTSPS